MFSSSDMKVAPCHLAFFSALCFVLLEHTAHLLHPGFELPHPFLTKLLEAFALYARYDLIRYPPPLQSTFGEADDLGPPVGRVRHALHVTRRLELVDGVAQSLLGRVGSLGQLGQAKAPFPKVVEDVSAPRRVAVGVAGGSQLSVQPHE